MPEVVKDLSFCMLLIFYMCSTFDGFSITVSNFHRIGINNFCTCSDDWHFTEPLVPN